MVVPSAALLMISDGRWPTGGHAHSGGLEAAIRARLVTDATTLEHWLGGRLRTAGRVDASFTAAAWSLVDGPPGGGEEAGAWPALIEEYWARVPAPALRAASRAMARAVLRAAGATWPARVPTDTGGLPWPIAFGVCANSAGLALEEVVLASAAASVQGPAWSATRLMGLDPYAVAGCLARLVPAVEEEAAGACQWGHRGVDFGRLPAPSAPLLDIGSVTHSTWEVRLFAS